MIAKCIVIFAIVAQINAACHQRAFAASSCGSGCGSQSQKLYLAQAAAPAAAPVATLTLRASGNSGSSWSSASSSSSSSGSASGSGSQKAITKNIYAKGKYPVALSNCGPTPDKHIPVTTSHSTAPLQEKPTIRLPANIPEPRTLDHYCTCYKTLLRPRVHDHYVTVPSVQRYIETSHTPVVENIHYEAEPVNCRDESENKYYFVKAEGQQASSQGSSQASFGQALEFAAPAAQATQTVELLAAPAQQAAQSVQLIAAAPAQQAAQSVQLIAAAPAQQAAQSVQLIAAAPAQQAAQSVQLVAAAPAQQAAQSVQLIAAAPAQQAAPAFRFSSGCQSCN